MKKILTFIGIMIAIAVVSAVFYPEAWQNSVDAGGNDLTNIGDLSADTIHSTNLYVDNIYGANSTCYQETANISTSCGGLSTGSYLNTSNWLDAGNFYDGNWSSATTYNGTNGSIGYYYVNYTKPGAALSASKWQIKREVAVNNYSIDANCFSQTILEFRGVAINSSTGLGSNYWQCYNGSIFINTTASQNGLKLYEEAMVWALSTNPFINASIDWINLRNYPAACPGSSAITQLNDSVTCSDLWVDVAGDAMSGNLDVTGNLTGNNYYGEMWNYTSNATAWVFPIGTDGVYYNITGLAPGGLNGFTFNFENQTSGGSYLTANFAGRYKVDSAISVESVGTNQLYAFAIVKNHNINANGRKCYSRRYISNLAAVGAIPLTCFMDLNIGDNISLQVENEGGTSDLEVHAINVNIMRLGD